jgi:small subunit ribosomal protein S17
MSDDEQKKEELQDEGAGAAGPADAGDPPSPAEQETVPPTTSPTAEDESADAEAPAEEAAEEAPAVEEASEPNPEDDLPWKERRRLAKSRRPVRKALPSDPEERKALRAGERKRKAELRRKQRAAAKSAHTAGAAGTPPAERESNAAKVRQGIVVSSKGDKSITVRIDIARRHRTYEKIVRSSTKLHAHDEKNEAGEGDVVRVIETRPLSKTKRWRLVDVVEKAR